VLNIFEFLVDVLFYYSVLVVSTGGFDCMERLNSEMCRVGSKTH